MVWVKLQGPPRSKASAREWSLEAHDSSKRAGEGTGAGSFCQKANHVGLTPTVEQACLGKLFAECKKPCIPRDQKGKHRPGGCRPSSIVDDITVGLPHAPQVLCRVSITCHEQFQVAHVSFICALRRGPVCLTQSSKSELGRELFTYIALAGRCQSVVCTRVLHGRIQNQTFGPKRRGGFVR